MNKELVRKVLNKGFKAKTLTTIMIDNSILYPDRCPEVSNKVSWSLWLSEVQKWLREKHTIDMQIFIMGVFMDKTTQPHSNFKKSAGFKKYHYGVNIDTGKSFEGFDIYEKALEKGIEDSIKVIKDEI